MEIPVYQTFIGEFIDGSNTRKFVKSWAYGLLQTIQ